jgi:hypothetical protein
MIRAVSNQWSIDTSVGVVPNPIRTEIVHRNAFDGATSSKDVMRVDDLTYQSQVGNSSHVNDVNVLLWLANGFVYATAAAAVAAVSSWLIRRRKTA